MCFLVTIFYLLIGLIIALLNNHLLLIIYGNIRSKNKTLSEDLTMIIILALMVVFWPVCLSITLRLLIIYFKYHLQ